MSVREITDRFIGLRVQRKVAGETKPRIKNFSFRIPVRRQGVTGWRDATETERKEIWARANALDKEWADLQSTASVDHQKTWRPRSDKTNTGVTGIRYKWAPDSQGYMIEAFWVNITVNSKTHAAAVRLSNRTWKAGWTMAVDKLVAFRGLDQQQREHLLKLMPRMNKLREAAPSAQEIARVRADFVARRNDREA